MRWAHPLRTPAFWPVTLALTGLWCIAACTSCGGLSGRGRRDTPSRWRPASMASALALLRRPLAESKRLGHNGLPRSSLHVALPQSVRSGWRRLRVRGLTTTSRREGCSHAGWRIVFCRGVGRLLPVSEYVRGRTARGRHPAQGRCRQDRAPGNAARRVCRSASSNNGTMHSDCQLAAYTGSTHDRGIWWVAADKLCQRWNNWLGGKSYCFTLRQQGAACNGPAMTA